MKRRNFILSAGLGLLGAKSLNANPISDPQDSIFYYKNTKKKEPITKVFPKRLKEGSVIAITAPASPINEWNIRGAIKTFQSLGCSVKIGKTIKDQDGSYRYFSASEEDRAKELMDFVQDPEVDAILCGRGGYGVMRILDKLDFDEFRKNPKIIIGYSDITALLNSIYNISGVVTFHGPVASSEFNRFTLDNFKKVLFVDEMSNTSITDSSAKVIQSGTASGNLVGGNLKMIVSTLRTPYEINTDNSILFLEDIDEHPYKIDRMLTQMKLSGKLDSVNGFIFGIFKGLNKREPFYPNNSYTLLEVIEQLIVPLGKPILIDMPIGHIAKKLTLPIGVNTSINTDTKSIDFLESPVSFI